MKITLKSILLFICFIALLSNVFAIEPIVNQNELGKMNTDVCAGKNQATCLIFEFAQIKCYWNLHKGKCEKIYP